jgi:hypothetical protein
MVDTVGEASPFGGENLVEYSVFLSRSFGKNPSTPGGGNRVAQKFLDSPSVPKQIESFKNDDSYRQSRHFLKNSALSELNQSELSLGLKGHLRENSLARQLQSKRDQPAIIRLLKRVKGEQGGEGSGP